MATHARRGRTLARIFSEARPYRMHIGGLLALSLLSTPLALLQPLPLKLLVDSVLGSKPLPDFLAAVVPERLVEPTALTLLAVSLFVAVVLLRQLQSMASALLQTYAGERLTLRFRSKLLAHVQRLSFAFHDARGTADSLYRIQYDAPAIQQIAVSSAIPFVSAAVTLASMIYVMLRIDPQLALIALTISPLLYLYARTYRRRLRPQHKRAKHLESSALKVMHEVLTSLRVVKAFGREIQERERFVAQADRGVHARIRIQAAGKLFDLVVHVTTAVGTALVLYVGVRNVQAGVLTLGDLLVVYAYILQLYTPLETISRRVASLQNQLVGAERAFELLDEVPEVRERPGAKPLVRAEGSLRFRGVTFAYGDQPPVLRDVSFDVPAGTCVGILGPTGAGKTTLVSLVTRFYDPNLGAVELDGMDLRDIRLADLRRQFAIMLQEPVLFSTSIAENVAYTKPGASAEEIVAAACAAGAHEFVSGLPEGYDTLVGERGMRLSGGERQRISLARAFLKDAPLLILDEPTSSVDRDTETAILAALRELMRGRTTFMISHRVAALRFCDLLLEIRDGRVAPVPESSLGEELRTAGATR